MQTETEKVIDAAAEWNARREAGKSIRGLVRWLDALEKEVGREKFLSLMPNNVYGRRNSLEIAEMLEEA